jgi:hypothetical protein
MKLKAPSRHRSVPDPSSAPLKARDAETRTVVAVLKKAFPRATVSAYRYAGWSIRVRVIDPGFRRLRPFDRIDKVSDALEGLPSDIQQKIMRVVPITPAEHRNKVWSHDYDFEHPLPFGA